MHEDDASSNPLNAEHLPVGGEMDDEGEGPDPDIADDFEGEGEKIEPPVPSSNVGGELPSIE
jgi:hypothetical protein